MFAAPLGRRTLPPGTRLLSSAQAAISLSNAGRLPEADGTQVGAVPNMGLSRRRTNSPWLGRNSDIDLDILMG